MPDQLIDVASALLGCLCDRLAETLGGPVCRCCLEPGQSVPMDVCCDCGKGNGKASVRLAAVTPVAQARGRCTADDRWVATLEMQVHRCAAPLQADGQPPTCAQVTRDAAVAMDDAAAMRRAVICCPALDGLEATPGVWTPLGPLGGCHGGLMLVTVAFYECCPQPAG